MRPAALAAVQGKRIASGRVSSGEAKAARAQVGNRPSTRQKIPRPSALAAQRAMWQTADGQGQARSRGTPRWGDLSQANFSMAYSAGGVPGSGDPPRRVRNRGSRQAKIPAERHPYPDSTRPLTWRWEDSYQHTGEDQEDER